MNHGKKRNVEDIEIGFNLYKLPPKKPASRPTSLPPGKRGGSEKPREFAVQPPAANKPSVPFRRPLVVPAANQATKRTVSKPSSAPSRQSDNNASPHGLAQPLHQQQEATPSPPLAPRQAFIEEKRDADSGDDDEVSVPLSVISNLELSFTYLLEVEQQSLPPDVVQALTTVRQALKQDRRTHQCQQPFVRLALIENEKKPLLQPVLRCLAEAAQSTTLQGSLARLEQLVKEAGKDVLASRPMCLVKAEWAMRKLDGLQGAEQSGAHDAAIAEKCFSFLEEAVELGHAGAMLFIGCSLRDGMGVELDLTGGISWIERAAMSGYAPALYEMGEMFERGVERGEMVMDADWGEALLWYSKAAEKGYALAQLNLGKLLYTATYQQCKGASISAGDRDDLREKGMDWLDMAAANGNKEAQQLRERL